MRQRQKYIRVRNHPILGNTRIEEHRLISTEKIGRKLLPNEVVHHKDHNRKNNDPSNLFVMTKKEHDALHADERRGVPNIHAAGIKLTEEHKQKISAAQMGNKSMLGMKHKPETIEKIKASAALRRRDPATGRLL